MFHMEFCHPKNVGSTRSTSLCNTGINPRRANGARDLVVLVRED
jgi:hypothetical protein